jgi:hypothetical protein
MPEIICPICDTPNPVDAVICSMCHSRLSTPPTTTRSLTSPSEEPPQGKENLEWLERVRALNAMDQLEKYGVTAASASPEFTEKVPEPAAEVENPDWLHNTRDLNSDQKPPLSETPGEDLSWLNDLRASTGSLGSSSSAALSASATLAAAAMAQHQDEDDSIQKPGETQELTPRSSIPGSASDWLSKLGAAEEEEPLKPGFEESIVTPAEVIGPIIEYDIDRATGSLRKSSESPQSATTVSAESEEPEIKVSPSTPPSAVEKQVSPPPENHYPSTGKPGTDDLAFLDTLLASAAVSRVEIAKDENTPPVFAELPLDILPPQSTGLPEVTPDVLDSTPSWLEGIQNQSLPGELAPDQVTPAPGFDKPGGSVIPGKPANDSQVQDLRDAFRDTYPPAVIPDAGYPGAVPSVPDLGEPPNPPDLTGFQPDVAMPPTESLPESNSSTNLSAGILNEFIAPPAPGQKQTEFAPSEATPDLGQFPGFSPVELDKTSLEDDGFGVDLGGILPQDLRSESGQLNLEEIPGPKIEQTPSPALDSASVDITSIPPSEETPDWLKQYAGDVVIEEDQGSIFPSQESISQDLPAPVEFSAQEIPEVVPAPAEIQNQDWLNTVINDTPATPLDLFKDVEDPKFASTEEPPLPQDEQEIKPAAWVLEPGQHTGFTGPLPDWLQELEVSQDGSPEPSTPQIEGEGDISGSFVAAAAPPASDLRSAFPTMKPSQEGNLDGVSLHDLGIKPETMFTDPLVENQEEQKLDGISLPKLGIEPESIFQPAESSGNDAPGQAEWLSDLAPDDKTTIPPEPPISVPQPPQSTKEEKLPPTAASVIGLKNVSQAASVQPVTPRNQPTTASPGVPFGLESLPDWISMEADEAGSGSSQTSDQPGLAQAEMPGWLEALKPVGLAGAAFGNRRTTPDENTTPTGPLMDDTGSYSQKQILAASSTPLASASPVPPGSETQKQYATMMDQVLTRESPVVASVTKSKKRRNRLILAAVIVVVLLILLLSAAVRLGFLPMPQLFSAETVTFYNTVETLPENAAVLIVLDYSPAFAAELQPISQTLMDQLVAKEARMSFISTQPSGPFFADQLLKQVSERFPQFDLAGKTANIGYLAGGASGLQEFAIHPKIAISRAWDGQPLWSKPALAGISSLDQFSSVIVFTESIDSARDWIEQVQPRLGAVPLLVASSAQTWPLLQPYSSTNQVKGLVAGISGGAAYERILGKNDTGSDLWGLYLVGQFLAVLIILLGVVFRVYHENRSSKSKGKEI